ncbi:hypothetical protein AZE42_10357 [Rhizopogon vesiculosus]|uniref:Uncharacterized protein n=1 Tax=Rhizopogon vesiculosus TaxID=180088 RepID=A0A1J8Q4U8_9AGAM|nr:hypothetical protein AZE42_10357 [Rhizopogon vesiculosus]
MRLIVLCTLWLHKRSTKALSTGLPMDFKALRLQSYRNADIGLECSQIERHGDVSLGSLPVHITPVPPQIKRQSSFDFVLALTSTVDVDKNAELSPSLPPYSKEEFSGDLHIRHRGTRS